MAEATPGEPRIVHVEIAPPEAGVVVLNWPTPPRAPSRVLVPRVIGATVADAPRATSGQSRAFAIRTNVPGAKLRAAAVYLASTSRPRETDMLTTELGLAEWTAATAVIAGGMALLAVLLRTLIARAR